MSAVSGNEPMVRISALNRLLLCIAAGVVTGLTTAFFIHWQLAILLGWIVTAGLMSAWILILVIPLDEEATARVALHEDDSRPAAEIVLLLAAVFSLSGVATALSGATRDNRVATALIALVSVSVAWLVVQLLYTLRYAHLYYRDGGGIDFNQEEKPDYRDFMYVSFTLGMTYQVSDTNISSRPIRRTMTNQGLLSYVFGVGVVATMVNVVVSLFRG
ncbi:MAG TPA: DUF1345 domain-containing protein [Dongiaceae bacterium]|nr:DUF1345 domain-containing protein [Dongiaceae bacterium]